MWADAWVIYAMKPLAIVHPTLDILLVVPIRPHLTYQGCITAISRLEPGRALINA